MTKRWLINLLLLALIGGLGLFILNTPNTPDSQVTRIDGPAPDTITHITIQRRDLGDINLEKKNQHWWMTNPYSVPANEVPIKNLLGLSQAISHSQFSALNKNLADYGLQPARASIAFNGIEYLFGNIEHINKRRYVQKADTIHLTTDLFYHRLKTNTEAFISPRLIPEDSNITELQLPGLTVSQSAHGDWLLSGDNASENVSNDAIQTLLDHWHHKQAIQILPVGDSSGTQLIKVIFADDSMIQFSGKKSDNYVILIRKDLGLQYKLPADAANDLLTLK